MKKEEFTFLSSDKITNIRYVVYSPEEEPTAILQIAHGMDEFIDRYEGFAQYLCSKGFLVTGNDHLGHGGSVTDKSKWGYFAKEDGNRCLIEDMHELTKITKEKHPGLPYFLLGHSMGSFYARQYMFDYSNELNGAIVMGTGMAPKAACNFGMTLCKTMAVFKGWEYRSNLVNGIVNGSNMKGIENPRTSADWLTKDDSIVDWYLKEPRCTFVFTLNGFYNMFKGISRLYDADLINKVEKRLPVLFVSGACDPVGEYGAGVERSYKTLKDAGMIDVSMKLYPNDRHEILNETDKEEVYKDLYDWLYAKLTLR